MPEGVGLAEDSQTEDSPDSQPDGSGFPLRVLTPPREWAWARGRWPVRGRHEVVEEVRGTDYGRNWL